MASHTPRPTTPRSSETAVAFRPGDALRGIPCVTDTPRESHKISNGPLGFAGGRAGSVAGPAAVVALAPVGFAVFVAPVRSGGFLGSGAGILVVVVGLLLDALGLWWMWRLTGPSR